MNVPNAEKDEHGEDREANKARQHQQKLATLNLFRLLETSVQTSQFKVAGQIVVRAQEIVGLIKSARSSFDERNLKAVLELNQAAESFRNKVVRFESEARAAQAGQRQLSPAQKRQLPAEVAAVRSTSRKTNIFFERLVSALAEWSRIVESEQEQPGDSEDAVIGKKKQESVYNRDRIAYVPEPEVHRKTSVSAEGLNMMTMMVRQQFEELVRAFRSAKDRDVGGPVQSSFGAFSEGNYQTSRTRLKVAHEAFLHAANTRRMAHVEILEQRFQTLLQGTKKLAEATNQQREVTSVGQGTTSQTARKVATPAQELRRLRKIMRDEFAKVFPPGSSKEHRETATDCMKQIVSGPLTKLPEQLRSLLRVMNYAADINTRETKEAKEIIKRLATLTPEKIRPPRDRGLSRTVSSLAKTDADEEDGITLTFALPSTKNFTIDPVDLSQSPWLALDYQNASSEPAVLHVQVYNVADEALLSRSERIQVAATDETKSHAVDLAEKIDSRVADSLAVRIEFMDVPEHVEITKAIFKQG